MKTNVTEYEIWRADQNESATRIKIDIMNTLKQFDRSGYYHDVDALIHDVNKLFNGLNPKSKKSDRKVFTVDVGDLSIDDAKKIIESYLDDWKQNGC